MGKSVRQPFGEGFVVWSLADPENPREVEIYRTGGKGTHRNFTPAVPTFTRQLCPRVTTATSIRLLIQRSGKAGGGFALVASGSMDGGGSPASSMARCSTEARMCEGTEPIFLKRRRVCHPRHLRCGDFPSSSRATFPSRRRSRLTSAYVPRCRSARGRWSSSTRRRLRNRQRAAWLAGIVDVSDETKPRLISLFPQPDAAGGIGGA